MVSRRQLVQVVRYSCILGTYNDNAVKIDNKSWAIDYLLRIQNGITDYTFCLCTLTCSFGSAVAVALINSSTTFPLDLSASALISLSFASTSFCAACSACVLLPECYKSTSTQANLTYLWFEMFEILLLPRFVGVYFLGCFGACIFYFLCTIYYQFQGARDKVHCRACSTIFCASFSAWMSVVATDDVPVRGAGCPSSLMPPIQSKLTCRDRIGKYHRTVERGHFVDGYPVAAYSNTPNPPPFQHPTSRKV